MLNSPLLPNAARALKGGASIAKPRTNGEEEQKRKRRRPASLVPELGLGGLAVPSTEQEVPGLPLVLPSALPLLPSLVPVATEERPGPLSAPDLRPSLASLAPEQFTSSILAPEAEHSSPNAKAESPATARITAAPPAMEVSGPGLNSTEDNVEASHSEAFSAGSTSIGQEAKDPATGSLAESDKGATSESRETPAPVSTSVGVIAPPVAAVPATPTVHASDAGQPAQALSAAPKAVAVEGPESKTEAEPQPEASNEPAFLGNLAAAGSVQQGAVAVPAEHRASEQSLPDTARGGNVAAVSQQFGMTAGFLSQSAGTQVGVTSENGAKRVDSADSRFTGLTQAPASEIVRGISGDFVEELSDEFDQVRSTRETRAPVLRVELPGDPPAIERQDASLPLQLPTADRIRPPEDGDGDGLTAEETSVPLQPEGDSVQADTGTSPQIRLTGSAAPDHARAASGDAANLGIEICSQTTTDLHQAAAAKKIHRTGLLREDSVEIADSRQTASISASTEMLEYLETDVPAGVRRQADRDLAPSLNEALSAPRQKVQEATEDRETQVDQAFEEAVAETDAAGQDANDRQQQAISDGYAQVAAEKQAGLEEAREVQASFDIEVKQRHTAHQGEVRAKVETEQQKADDAIHKGEEDARKEIEDAREKEREARESAEREKPKQKKKKWYEKVGDWFKNAIKEWTDKLVAAVKTVFNQAKLAVGKILTTAKNLAVGIIRSVKKFVVAAVRTFTAGLKLLVNGLLVAFPKLRARVNQAIDQVVNATVTAIETIAQKLDAAVTAAADRVQSTVNRVLDFCELVIVTQVQIAGALLSGEFLDAARILFLAACKAVGIPGEELLGILADARGALIDIIKRPAKFLGYLLRSVGQGMKTFFSHFPKRMVAGLTGWLFGQVAQGAVNLPKSFDLKSIFGLLIQVMGFTYDYIRGKVVALVGEKAISVIEQVMAPIRILFTEGPGALWNWLADKAKEAKDAIVEAASQWFVTQIITQAAIKLATMFTPVGAFVQAVLMMYNTIMFFVEKIKEIFAWVKSITSSLKTIAVGAVSSAAEYIDQSMSKSIPLIIAFLARLLGIGGIGEKIRQVISKLRTPVDKAITFVVEKLIKLAKAAWGGIKKGATAIKGTVVGWWEAKEPFTDVTGTSHTLFIQREGERHQVMMASAVQKYEKLLAKIEAEYRASPDATKRETYERAKVAHDLLMRRIARLETREGDDKGQAELPELKELAIRSQLLMVETDGERTSVLEWVHLALDAAGMVPFLGIAPDAVNSGLYLIEGDWMNAGISAAAMIPILGEGATTTKYGVRASKEALERLGKEGLEKELKNAKQLGKKRIASTPAGRSRQSLEEFIRTGKGPWKRQSAHADKAVSQHPNAKARKNDGEGATNLEEIYVNTETREMLVRHRIIKNGQTIEDNIRSYSKFGVDAPPRGQKYPNESNEAYSPEPEIVQKQAIAEKSNRQKYMGRTPSKNSPEGKEVERRMRAEGLIRGNRVLDTRGTWRDIDKDIDMAHKVDAVLWWNERGRYLTREQVRTWMKNPDNYRWDYSGANRSDGARSGAAERQWRTEQGEKNVKDGYMKPATQSEKDAYELLPSDLWFMRDKGKN